MPTTLILFHWNECGACIQFMPIWDKEIGKKVPSIKVEVADITKDLIRTKNPKTLLTDEELDKILLFENEMEKKYPTIAKWDGNKVIEYPGVKRDPKLIKDWAKSIGGGKKRKRRVKTQFRKKGGKQTKKNCWWKLF
jgi:hypothetical protein